MTVQIHLKSEDLQADQAEALRSAAKETVRQATMDNAELTLVYTDDDTIQSLNQEYRDEDRVTDVLAFPMGESDPESGFYYLGDVVISLPQAERQASSAGHSLASELTLLTVHGVLHLLGHDHDDPEAKSEMWAAQDRALRELGVHLGDIDRR